MKRIVKKFGKRGAHITLPKEMIGQEVEVLYSNEDNVSYSKENKECHIADNKGCHIAQKTTEELEEEKIKKKYFK